jgi:signal transduction histidine kinase/phage shock protein PspC (stress-responsive transcriptional regulator)
VAVTRRHLQLRRSEFARPAEGRVVAGVAAGLADGLGLEANLVRCAFVVLGVASGLGLALYLLGWAVMPEGDPEMPRRPATTIDPISTCALGAVVLGCLLVVRAVGFWPGDVIVWPLTAAMVGLALLAIKTTPGADDETAELPPWPILERLPKDAADALAVLVGTRRGALARAIAGGCFVLAGVIAFVLSANSWTALRGAVIGGFAVLAGAVIVFGPGISRLLHELVTERGERIRADERAEVAAHLHDSVLQTLALVQRRADDPREVVRLARMQERELRAWLLAGGAVPEPTEAPTLGIALEELAALVEGERGVPVEVVRVRDCPVEGLEPMLAAAREAMTNAAQHSGAATISVYLEVEPERATIFVRDRGKGFEAAHIPEDRGGITNSIAGRMTRAGGRAEVRSTVGEGTEVELEMPRPKS